MNQFGPAFAWHFQRERARMAVLGLAAAVFVAVLLGLSDSVRPADIQEIIDKLPPAMLAMMGLNEGDLFDLTAWVGLIHNHPVLLVAILSFPLAAGLRGIAGGVDDGTLELVLAQPLGRNTYYLSLAAVVALGSTWVLVCSMLGGLIVRAVITLPGDLAASTLFQLAVSGWAFALSVAGITLLISVLTAGGGRPVSTAIGIVVAMFFCRFLSDMVEGASWLRQVSVFGYHDPPQLVQNGLAAGPVLILLAAAVVSTAIGLWTFKRKQLTF